MVIRQFIGVHSPDQAHGVKERRAERKDAIVGLLSETERTEQYRGRSDAGRGASGSDLIELLHAEWLAKKIIELICSAELAQAAQNYVGNLTEPAES